MISIVGRAHSRSVRAAKKVVYTDAVINDDYKQQDEPYSAPLPCFKDAIKQQALLVAGQRGKADVEHAVRTDRCMNEQIVRAALHLVLVVKSSSHYVLF